MKLPMALVLTLLSMLASQPTLIYGKQQHTNAYRSLDALPDEGTKFLLGFESAQLHTPLLSRQPRQSAGGHVPAATGDNTEGVGAGGKQRHAKKSNKNTATESDGAPAGGGGGGGGGGKQHNGNGENKFSGNQQRQHQGHNNNRGYNQQRQQFLKSHQSQSQQHHDKQNGERGGNGAAGIKARNGPHGEKNENGADGVKSQSTCRYAKNNWSECDAETNARTRTLTLKKGDANCLPTRTIRKKCMKRCRFEKGAWSECSNGEMSRQDTLIQPTATSVTAKSQCQPMRTITKKCGRQHGGDRTTKKERKQKDKVAASVRDSQQT